MTYQHNVYLHVNDIRLMNALVVTVLYAHSTIVKKIKLFII